jgi:hypothetical protein
MRESSRTEGMHLPRDSTELWLQSQAPARTLVRHRNPPTDFYEAWVQRKVRESVGRGAKTKKTPLGSAT